MRNKYSKIIGLFGIIAIISLVIGVNFRNIPTVAAADNDFSDGITVDSTGDDPDVNIADSICDDGSGSCTLRAALQESNDTAGTQTIYFNIAPFDGNVKTIQPATMLPSLEDTTIIDGYSQDTASPNTTMAPAALDGNLLIEINGSNIVDTYYMGISFGTGSDGSELRGLVINRVPGIGVFVGADNITIKGNYIGTDPTGLIDRGNTGAGISNGNISNDNAIIGGTNPEDRNIISGNEDAGLYPKSGWVIRGNYVGVDATGLGAMGNSTIGASGGMSIDDCVGVIVGGSTAGSANVISANLSHGLAPDNADGLIVQGNFIGVGRDGTTSLGMGNGGGGIVLNNSENVLIGGYNSGEGNIVSNSGNDGIYLGDTNTGVTVQGNTVENSNQEGISVAYGSGIVIGGTQVNAGNTVNNSTNNGINVFNAATDVTVQGNTVSSNTQNNISVNSVTGVVIGGTQVNAGNNVDSAGQDGINISNASSEVTVQGNSISNNSSNGVAISNSTIITIGGATSGSDNVIANNVSNGVNISNSSSEINVLGNTIDTNDYGISITSSTVITVGGIVSGSENTVVSNASDGISLGTGADVVSIISNSIYDNTGLGIDLNSDGVTANDTEDIDTGVNDLLNSPETNSITESSGNTNVAYSMDVPAGDYRIEFFGNTVADPSSYGEGETYLGFANITSNGTGDQLFSHTLTGITGVTNLSQTTTKRNVATPSGFGATSEFGKFTVTNDIALQKTISNPNNVAKGANIIYTVKFTNNGPSDINLSSFDGSGGFGVNPLFFDMYPADLTYVDNPIADANCTDLGPGAAGGFGSIFANHSDHGVIECVYDGAGEVLTAGQSFEIQLIFLVSQSSSLEFSNYVMNFSAPNDPDESDIGPLFAGELIDGLKLSGVNNFSEAQYPVPIVEQIPPNSTSDTASSAGEILQRTGDILTSWYGIVGVIVSGISFAYYFKHYRRKSIYKI